MMVHQQDQRSVISTLYLYTHLQVTYAFSSLITDSLNFPHHFRMVPSETNQMNGIVAFIVHFGWQRVIGIAEEQPVYISVSIC